MTAKVFLFSVLVSLVTVSSLGVVFVKYLNRSFFIELQELLEERDELRVEWSRLQLGYDSFGSQGRIERFAKEQLQMKTPDPEQIKIVVYE